MTTKCKFCSTPVSAGTTVCPVCKIDNTKDKAQLTPPEIAVWHAARNLRIVSMLTILRGILGIMASFFLLAPQSQPVPLGAVILTAVLSAACIWLGISLGKYMSWTYEAGLVLYGLFLILDFLSGRFLAVLVSAAFLYLIGNPTAKKILKHQL